MATNARKVKVKPLKRSRHADQLAWIRLGYVDAVAGRGFSQAYECADRVHQMNYERGRLWATAWMGTDRWPPSWPANTLLPRLLAKSNSLHMTALPDERKYQ
jgi:hypothetical protein